METNLREEAINKIAATLVKPEPVETLSQRINDPLVQQHAEEIYEAKVSLIKGQFHPCCHGYEDPEGEITEWCSNPALDNEDYCQAHIKDKEDI